ncbi:tRNA (32-2'-O)-methyltransferase regulator THADA-like isoform X2 [Corticium candelabrum]|nr:tRNA (32-2'-O)-methyltransferase regulator THADA-like isoform X2 [Corticium candelabrum]
MRERMDFGLDMTKGTAVSLVLEEMEQILDYLLSFSDNFKAGEICIEDLGVEILNFSYPVLAIQVNIARQETILICQQKAIEGCMSTVKLATVVMQKCHETVKIIHAEDKSVQSIMAGLLQSLRTILEQSLFIKDCQSCAGLALINIFRITMEATGDSQQVIDLLRLSTGRFSWIGNLSDFARHCVYRGFLAVMPLEDVSAKTSSTSGPIVVDVVLPELLLIARRSTEASFRLALAHTLVLWTSVVKSFVFSLTNPTGQADVSCLKPGSVMVSGLLEYLWANWDDHMDGMRYQVRLIFDSFLSFEKLILSLDEYRNFLSGLLDRVSAEDWRVRGKYGPLYCLVPHFGATQILSQMPTIYQQLLKIMDDRNVAPHAKDLIEKLASVHKTELQHSGTSDMFVWNTTWIDPVIDVLCSCDSSKKLLFLHIVEFCIPVLLKCNPLCMSYTLEILDSKQRNGHDTLSTMISFLKVARVFGILFNCQIKKTNAESFWYGAVPVDKLRDALCHANDQVRSDALSLVCQSNRTTEAVSTIDFDLLRSFLTLNMNNQSSAFRSIMLSTMKKFFSRVRDSARVLLKSLCKATESEAMGCHELLAAYRKFLNFVVELVFDGLHPDASFQRVTSSLQLLDGFMEIFQGDLMDSWFQLSDCFLPHHVHALILTLEDSYDVNRHVALSVLYRLPVSLLPLERKGYVESLTTRASSLICSPRTIACSTGACYVRLLAKTVISQLGLRITLGATSNNYSLTTQLSNVSLSERSPLLHFVWDMLHMLQHQAAIVKQNFSFLAKNCMYGILMALRFVLADIHNINGLGYSDAWKEFFQSLIDTSLLVADIVGPVVTHSSPEGHLTEDGKDCEEFIVPMDKSVLELGQSDISSGTCEGQENSFSPTSQLVLVCSWRCMKEVSLLLGDLVERLSLQTIELSGLLTVKQVKTIGDFFTKQLTECRHRGAFEVAYTGFVKHCKSLWKSCDSELQQLPVRWMNELLDMLQSATASQSLSFTRRSAGLPFFIQTVLATEPSISGRTCLQQVMAGLIAIASKPLTGTLDEESSLGLPQVHALNTLRALFRETRLGDHVIPFVSDGVIVAITGISSDCWAVRNSSTLLYSALIARVFGATRSQNLHAKHNCMTGRQFFSMFPSLHSFLLEELKKATADEVLSSGQMRLHPSLYSVLLLLSKLYPSSMEGADSALNLQCFVSFVLRCGSSSVMKTRTMAASALVPLISFTDLPAIVEQLVDVIPSRDSEGLITGVIEQNQLHGVLLQLSAIFCCHLAEDSMTPSHVIAQLFCSIQALKSRLWIATRSNVCSVTRTLFINFLHKFVVKHERAGELISLASTVVQKCVDDELKHVAVSSCVWYDVVGNVDLKQALLQTALDNDDTWTGAGSGHFLKLLLQHQESSLRYLVINCVAQRWSYQETRITDHEKWLLPFLCKMAVETEHDAECLCAMYRALTAMTYSATSLSDMRINAVELISTVFKQALSAIKRPELCQAMISYGNRLICMLAEEQFAAEDKLNELLQQWILLIQQCARDEQVLELRLAAAHSLHTLGIRILLINHGSFLMTSLTSWIQLWQLLQDDDAAVRQAAACCISLVYTHIEEGPEVRVKQIQPSRSIHLIPQLLVSIYATNSPMQLFEWLLNLLWEGKHIEECVKSQNALKGDLEHAEDSVELFMKGDINPYAEATVKIDVASDALKLLLQSVASKDDDISQAILSKTDSLFRACLKSVTEFREAEKKQSFFFDQQNHRARFLNMYVVVRTIYALSPAGHLQLNDGEELFRDLHGDKLWQWLPKLGHAFQLL